MAKNKAAKETSMPVIVALVFFVLTTIGFGVFSYVLYSDQQSKDDASAKKDKEVSNARTGEAEAVQVAIVHRVLSGLAEGDDLEKFGQIKEGDKAFQEYKRLIELWRNKVPAVSKVAAGAAKVDPPVLGEESLLPDPVVDEKKQLQPPPRTFVDIAAQAQVAKSSAIKQMLGERENYVAALVQMRTVSEAYRAAKKVFDEKSIEVPATLKAKMDSLEKLALQRLEVYRTDVAAARKQLDDLSRDKEDLQAKNRAFQTKVTRLSDELTQATSRKEIDPLQFDEPQGKILRRLDDNIVEIDLGSNARVARGLTFTILPYDYPEKGRRSQMRLNRYPDERGVYRSVEQFTPKATIEVIDVIGPNLSRARITSEEDRIRNGALPGDLLYNAVWRKGQTDHVALIGIFDTNGDGTDDIESVVRDLNKMGITVDAYFDLRSQKWVGRLEDRTRYLVEGYIPNPLPNDPYLNAKVKMNGSMKAAKDEAITKGLTIVNFRDFFGKMGYRVRIDVSPERISQAAARYLSGLGSTGEPGPKDE
jgi:hypothetical protein